MPPQHSLRLRRLAPRYGNDIRRYRLQLGLTQLEVARSLGTRSATVSSWERGQTCPTGPMLLKLAKVLNTLAEALYPQFYALAPGGVTPSAA